MAPLLESFLGKIDVFSTGLLRFLDEAMQKDHGSPFDGEKRAHDPVAERSTDLPDRTAEVIHARLADRPLVLDIGNILADCLAL